jgi:hypothetical protein
MRHPQPHACDAAAVEIGDVVVVEDHGRYRLSGARKRVVVERKISRYELQVNAWFMSSCVSNAPADIARRDDEVTRRNVT